MPSFLSRQRLWLRFAAAFAAVFLLLTLPARFTAPYRVVLSSSLQPVRRGVFSASGDFHGLAGAFSFGIRLADRNRALETRVLELQDAVLGLQEQLRQKELERGGPQHAPAAVPGFRPVMAHVLGYDASPMRRAVQIDAGEDGGLRRGLGASFAGAVVGIVGDLSGTEGRVLLLTDPSVKVPCRLQRTRIPCIAAGNGSDEIDLLWVKRESDVAPGDLVVTSRLAVKELDLRSLVPDGLPLGTVVSCEPSKTGPLLMRVRVQPLVRLDRLERVEVLVPE